jgi:hypothetical protein
MVGGTGLEPVTTGVIGEVSLSYVMHTGVIGNKRERYVLIKPIEVTALYVTSTFLL